MNREIKTNRKTQYTRKVLRDSLVELMRQKPVSKITIKELCQTADINRTTFYVHYRDQYDLLQQIEEDTISYVAGMLDKYENKRSRREVIEMVEEMVGYIANNSNSIQVLLSENGDINFQKRLFNLLTHQEQIIKYFNGKTIDEETREYYSIFFVNGAIGFMQHWLKKQMNIPVPQLARMLIKFDGTWPVPEKHF
ncbi:MAG: TetR family transcriptional regulator C-terminal domain-containing protein [Treponema sp.]|jgi:AcrR family transcriptional regulator|nr:TetR family transcriptional regulator C-terminal domain-containing protein [Treponema sp.]